MNKIVKRVLLAGSITAAIIGGIWYATPSAAQISRSFVVVL